MNERELLSEGKAKVNHRVIDAQEAIRLGLVAFDSADYNECCRFLLAASRNLTEAAFQADLVAIVLGQKKTVEGGFHHEAR